MNKFKASMFCSLRAAECVIVDGLLVHTFQLQGAEGGAGILNLEDGSSLSFANQEITVIGGRSAFHTEAEKPHSIDSIASGDRGLSQADLPPAAPSRTEPPSAWLPMELRPLFHSH